MDFNYTLKYRTFDQLLEDVTIDLNSFALESMIEPQQLIKLAKRVNYDLGLRLNQTKEIILDVCHGKVKLPDDFYTFNSALICNEFELNVGYDGFAGGTNIQEVPYKEFPATLDQCALPTVNCRTCNSNPCNHTAACDLNSPIVNPIPTEHDPLNPYGDTCIAPRVFMNCKGEKYEIIQVINQSTARVYRNLVPLRMKASQEIECDCPNLYINSANEGWIKGGFLFTTFDTGKVYLNYQGQLEDEQGQLLVPDHDLLNEYYEYALKARIMENLYLNGEDVAQRLALIEGRLKAARNQALSLVNTPNFKELYDLWWTNRRAQHSKYYDMFTSHAPTNAYRNNPNATRVVRSGHTHNSRGGGR
jgi:hypothetical protein